MAEDKSFLLAPMQLKRKNEIAETFSVDPATVGIWAREGAPIFLVGNKYQAEYYSLVDWLVKNRPAFKKQG